MTQAGFSRRALLVGGAGAAGCLLLPRAAWALDSTAWEKAMSRTIGRWSTRIDPAVAARSGDGIRLGLGAALERSRVPSSSMFRVLGRFNGPLGLAMILYESYKYISNDDASAYGNPGNVFTRPTKTECMTDVGVCQVGTETFIVVIVRVGQAYPTPAGYDFDGSETFRDSAGVQYNRLRFKKRPPSNLTVEQYNRSLAAKTLAEADVKAQTDPVKANRIAPDALSDLANRTWDDAYQRGAVTDARTSTTSFEPVDAPSDRPTVGELFDPQPNRPIFVPSPSTLASPGDPPPQPIDPTTLPGSASNPAKVDWGTPPPPPVLGVPEAMDWFPNPFVPPTVSANCVNPGGNMGPLFGSFTLPICEQVAPVAAIAKPLIVASSTIVAGRILLDL